MYYVLGLYPSAASPPPSDSFETLFASLSPTCAFLPASGKSFTERLRFSLHRKRTQNLNLNSPETLQPLRIAQEEEAKLSEVLNASQIQSIDCRFEIEDLDKGTRYKVIDGGMNEYRVIVAVYCSQGVRASNHKELKVRIYNV